MITIDQQVAGNHNRRMAGQARFLNAIDAREDAAEAMVGQLVREGKTIYYVMPQGGKYREGKRLELIAFLIRNDYA